MAFDQEKHEIDPQTGFAVDKETGVQVGLEQAPLKPVSDDLEFPKWVVPHESRVFRKKSDNAPDHVSTPDFENFHVNRVDGSVTVLVKNEDEENIALSNKELKS